MPIDFAGLLSGSYWSGIEVTAKPLFVTFSVPTVAPGPLVTLTDLTPEALASSQSFSEAEAQLARDALDGGPGNDRLTGGQGDDTYVVTGPADNVIEAAEEGTDSVIPTTSHILAAGVGGRVLHGTTRLSRTGNDLDNSIFAGGSVGQINGMAGDDYLVGGAARDHRTGGSGSDDMFGGPRGDAFVFAGTCDYAVDAIGDFAPADGDKISLERIDPDTLTHGDQRISFVGTADNRFQVRIQSQGNDLLVRIDLNHDTSADATILLCNTATLPASDFLL
jgi:Ca2+-binding RTX toxin-like protein